MAHDTPSIGYIELLFGIGTAFVVEVMYDFYGYTIFTDYMPQEWWGLLTAFFILIILFSLYIIRSKLYKIINHKWVKKHLVSILIILFLLFSILLIKFILMPYSILSPDFGDNLISECIGMIVTVFIIDNLLNWSDNRMWGKVKESVYHNFGIELYGIVIDIKNFINLPNNLVVVTIPPNASQLQTQNIWRNLSIRQFDFICENQIINVNNALTQMIANNGYGDLFETRKNHLDSIELKYWKYFEPDIVEALINLQRRLHSLHLTLRIRQQAIARGNPPLRVQAQFNTVVATAFQMIFREIKKIHENGVEIFFD